jgi:hypothetical protein
LAIFALAVSALAMVSACTPPELLQTEETVTDVGTDSSIDVGGQEIDVPEEVTFGQVADIIRNSCAATPSCHGGSGFTNFSVEAGGTASDVQVREALEDVTTLDGFDLVAPEDAQVSALYLRLVDTGSKIMPPDGQPPLEQSEIETVRRWIEEGANYE